MVDVLNCMVEIGVWCRRRPEYGVDKSMSMISIIKYDNIINYLLIYITIKFKRIHTVGKNYFLVR